MGCSCKLCQRKVCFLRWGGVQLLKDRGPFLCQDASVLLAVGQACTSAMQQSRGHNASQALQWSATSGFLSAARLTSCLCCAGARSSGGMEGPQCAPMPCSAQTLRTVMQLPAARCPYRSASESLACMWMRWQVRGTTGLVEGVLSRALCCAACLHSERLQTVKEGGL